MLPLKANFKNGKEDIMCSLCDEGEEKGMKLGKIQTKTQMLVVLLVI